MIPTPILKLCTPLLHTILTCILIWLKVRHMLIGMKQSMITVPEISGEQSLVANGRTEVRVHAKVPWRHHQHPVATHQRPRHVVPLQRRRLANYNKNCTSITITWLTRKLRVYIFFNRCSMAPRSLRFGVRSRKLSNVGQSLVSPCQSLRASEGTLSRWFRLHLQSLAPTNQHRARVVGYSPFSLCVIHKEGLCSSSGDINRLMMMINLSSVEEGSSSALILIVDIRLGKLGS
jgi:hypothetical protein